MKPRGQSGQWVHIVEQREYWPNIPWATPHAHPRIILPPSYNTSLDHIGKIRIDCFKNAAVILVYIYVLISYAIPFLYSNTFDHTLLFKRLRFSYRVLRTRLSINIMQIEDGDKNLEQNISLFYVKILTEFVILSKMYCFYAAVSLTS